MPDHDHPYTNGFEYHPGTVLMLCCATCGCLVAWSKWRLHRQGCKAPGAPINMPGEPRK